MKKLTKEEWREHDKNDPSSSAAQWKLLAGFLALLLLGYILGVN